MDYMFFHYGVLPTKRGKDTLSKMDEDLEQVILPSKWLKIILCQKPCAYWLFLFEGFPKKRPQNKVGLASGLACINAGK